MNFTLAFKKPTKGIMDWFLEKRIGKYIHVELIFPEPLIYMESSFSSRGRVKHLDNIKRGVHFAKLDYDENWDFLSFNVSQKDALKIRKTAQSIVGAKYDNIGAIFWAAYDIPIERKSRWWCSEAIAHCLGIEKYRLTPVELYDYVKNNDIGNMQ